MSTGWSRHRALACGLAALALAAACTSETVELTDEAEARESTQALALTPPEHGFQLQTMGTAIAAGDDMEWCEVLQVPGSADDVFYVNRFESAMTPMGHDLVILAAEPHSETAEAMEVGTRVDCQRAGEAFGEDLRRVTSARRLYRDDRYPEGVGREFYGGQKIVVDYHYFNTSDRPIVAKAKVNFHVVDETKVARFPHAMTFENLTIYTPPGGTSSHMAECYLDQDIYLGRLNRRTQRWGTTFRVWFVGGERDGQHIWTSRDWEQDTEYVFEGGPVLLKAGEGLRFQCDYRNTTDEPLSFGYNATDESCGLDAMWWTAEPSDDIELPDCLLFPGDVEEDGVARKWL